MTTFTNKAWVVTEEYSHNYDRDYKLVGIFNTPAKANQFLKDKLEENLKKLPPYILKKSQYRVNEVVMDGSSPITLFTFKY